MTESLRQSMLIAAKESLCAEFAELLSKPVLMCEKEIGRVISIVKGKLKINITSPEKTNHFICDWDLEHCDDEHQPYKVTNGVAVIPIMGVLLNRFPYMCRWATGYEILTKVIQHAVKNPQVKKVLLDINCPGGSAAGCFETAEFIREAGKQKDIIAHVNSLAASGGYALASAAKEIHAIPSSSIGSIGVVLTHWSYEKLLEEDGVKVTHIYAGEHKVDGTPYKDMPKDVQQKFQREVEETWDVFASLVASHRNMEIQAVVDTQADIFSAKKAMELGLIDGELAAHELPEFLTNLTKSNTGVFIMAEEKKPEANASVTQEKLEQEKAEAAKAATARIQAILGSEEAKDRQKLANHLAFNCNMSAEDAIETLKVSAKEAQAAPTDGKGNKDTAAESLNRAMETGKPNLGSEEEGNDVEAVDLSPAQRVSALLHRNKKSA